MAQPHALSSAPRVSTESEPDLGYAAYVLFVLMVCYTLSFVDRQILSLLVAPIKRDLGISDTRVSVLQGLAFALFYTTLGLPMGRVADRRSRRSLITGGVFFWSVMTTLCAAARSFWSLFAGRMGVGVGEATLAPGAFSIITDYFPKRHLARAMSVYSMGIFIGSGLALIVGGSVVQATARVPFVELPLFGVIASWRLTFLLVGVPGVLVALWVATLREPRRRGLLIDGEGRPAELSPGQVFAIARARWQSILGISIGMVFQSMCTYGLTFWTPTVLQRIHGWTPRESGNRLGVVIICFGCLGMYAGGALTDYWRRRGIADAPMRVGIVSAVGTAVVFGPALTASSPATMLWLFAPGMVFLGLPMGVVYAALQWILPNQARGQISALFLLMLNLGGQTLGPFVPAWFSDHVFQSERMIGVSLALSTVLAAALMLVTFGLTCRPYRIDSAAMERIV
jgi:MFS family permease